MRRRNLQLTIGTALLFCSLSLAAHASLLKQTPLRAGSLTGTVHVHTVKKGDTLDSIGKKYGYKARYVGKNNGIKTSKELKPGMQLRIPDLRVIPGGVQEGVVVNIPERRLYVFRQGKLDKTISIAVGVPPRWGTPIGNFKIVTKQKAPTWFVPKSIQAEMKEAGKPVKTVVPPGPGNPLGNYWMGIGGTGIGIHSTTSPYSIGQVATHGCIRMHPSKAAEMFERIKLGDPVRIVYHPFKVASDETGVYLEAHPNVYGLKEPNIDHIKSLLGADTSRVDWTKVKQVIRDRLGVPVIISQEVPQTVKSPTPNTIESPKAVKSATPKPVTIQSPAAPRNGKPKPSATPEIDDWQNHPLDPEPSLEPLEPASPAPSSLRY